MSDHDHNDGSNPTAYKIMSIVCVFVLSFVSGCIPVFFTRCRSAMTMSFLGLVNSFAAGIFLTMGLAHLLPEAAEHLAEAYGEETNIKFRIAYMLCIAGYTLILCVQRVIVATPHHHHGEADCTLAGHDHSEGGSKAQHPVDPASPVEGTQVPVEPVGQSPATTEATTVTTDSPAGAPPSPTERPLVSPREPAADPSEAEYAPSNSLRHTSQIVHAVEQALETDPNSPASPEEIAHKKSMQTTYAAYVLIIALGLHSIIAGLALGVQSSKRDTLLLFIAIMAHQWAESISLGVTMTKSTLENKHQVILMFVFSLSVPLGIGIGWIAESKMPDSATGYLLAISAGTFLYIGASELVVEEFVQGKRHWEKLISFMVGCVAILLVTAYADLGHDHGHEGHDH
jgi:zinc transporter 1/2/3